MDKNNMEIPKRKPTRLQDYDYSSAGAYFVTICTKDRKCIFWNNCRDNPCGCPMPNDEIFSPFGKIANSMIGKTANKFDVIIDVYAVMPNHIHMIIILEHGPAETAARAVPTISEIVGAYKSMVAVECLKIFKAKGEIMGELWQRSFHDHIIRGEKDYREISEYIESNPAKWEEDRFFSD